MTTFSKIFALLLFILLPFVGFLIGSKYQAKLDSIKFRQITSNSVISPTPTAESSHLKNIDELPGPNTSFPNSKMEKFAGAGFSFQYPDYMIITSNSEVATIWKVKPNFANIGPIVLRTSAERFTAPTVGSMIDDGNNLVEVKSLNSPTQFKLDGKITNYYSFSCGPDCGHQLVNFQVGEKYYQLVSYYSPIKIILATFKFTDSNSSPTPTCMMRPACLDNTPHCMIAEPANGWCPK